ncbi:hypothetical protein BO94DRAFT_626712 [Aspergillus sclerotioniger CBS 115572]|uniref:Uncharacterized protein n=1 Tax=Aspergillus sclerotioniger CBS 115572 TaxID=1450535 RepID=A0A317VV02_9EURO|nr:hypothetical protein BO94DRAFT_626712 [Aspergillus sclerotioniger CBS 115572]PWY78133.1 hypothetical protein BO94DRAFT_626712 [Aspergillus sclerotioniger CBS 115572]
MRLHLIIQRHGLPVTRILWTTSPPSAFGHNAPSASSMLPAASSALASTRVPNALYSSGSYTIAQLLEDVNEVVPLETEPALFDSECSGQWGLEDYVVEVGGSECLHFMEVEGLLRDGDEVLIRALQMSDLRVRRLSGRHQISSDGKHLIDGVPFGKPFLKRPTASRPAITIPPRKRRRTTASGWDYGSRYEEDDTEWAPTNQLGFTKELSVLKSDDQPQPQKGRHDEYVDACHDDYEDYHEPEEEGDGTVIRHAVDEAPNDQTSESDSDMSNNDDEDLAEELKGLEEDLEVSSMPVAEDLDVEQAGYSLRSKQSAFQTTPRKRPLGLDETRRDSKMVTFEDQKMEPSVLNPNATPISKAGSAREDPIPSVPDASDSSSSESDSSDSSDSSISSDSSNSSDSSSDEDSDSASEVSSSDSEDDTSSDSDDMSTSESEDELSDSDAELHSKTIPPGAGSLRTKKSNQRNKMRRRLAKLKELGALPAQADFAALREWEETNGRSYYVPEQKGDAKEQERAEFEAKRQKLLRDLESGGIDVTVVSHEDMNLPQSAAEIDQTQPAAKMAADDGNQASPPPKRRTLDVASSRRMLFGSLGVRTPRTKEDEEATRKKLAGKIHPVQAQKPSKEDTPKESESDLDENWQNKLILRATECIYDDIKLTPPPFPFEQRWDTEAGDIIRQRKGWGKKRKRRQQLQVYNGEEEEYGNGDYSYSTGDIQLNYDDTEQPNGDMEEIEYAVEPTAEEQLEDTANDLPALPSDTASLQGMGADDLKKGMVFAFRQLEISKATSWQPTVSGYRVAKIHDVFEDDIVKIRLAKRDRRQARDDEDWDEENDQPQYSGFEMPGLDDEEDDGFRELSFADLIEPKLLRAADAAGLGDVGKPSISCAAEECSPPSPKPAPNEAAVMREYDDGQPPARDTGKERADRDAKLLNQEIGDAVEEPAINSSPIQSPQFVGFQSPGADSTSASKASREEQASGSALPLSGQDTEDDRNDRQPDDDLEIKDPPSALHSTHLPVDPDEGNEAAPLSDNELQMISSLVSAMSSNCLMEKYFPPAVKGEAATPPTKQEPEDSLARSPSQSSTCSFVPNPFYEVDRAEEERQRQRAARKGRRNGNPDGGDGTMEGFSLARSVSPVAGRSPRVKKSPVEEPSSISVVPESVPRYYEEPGQAPPKSPASQVSFVDLTLSSPPQSPGGSDEDYARSHQLPRGSGWVQKNVPRTRRVTRQSIGRR